MSGASQQLCREAPVNSAVFYIDDLILFNNDGYFRHHIPVRSVCQLPQRRIVFWEKAAM
jgi:hypothetical protein